MGALEDFKKARPVHSNQFMLKSFGNVKSQNQLKTYNQDATNLLSDSIYKDTKDSRVRAFE